MCLNTVIVKGQVTIMVADIQYTLYNEYTTPPFLSIHVCLRKSVWWSRNWKDNEEWVLEEDYQKAC